MANKLILKNGAGVPAPERLEMAELALDTENGSLYSKLGDGSVVQLNDGADGVDLSGYVLEAPDDGKQYVRESKDWSELVLPDGGTGSSVHIGDTPPDDPQEGQQWMEVPADGDATMWIYDGNKWLQHPSGKDGAPGADGNIADATEQGVVATWDDTNKQWTPDSSLTIDASGDATFSGKVTAKSLDTNVMRINSRNIASDHFGLQFGSTLALIPCDPSNTNTNGVSSLGLSSFRFKDCYLSGSVISTRHGISVGTRDLIETLSTLRNATKDENTLEGLRDAIGNAVETLVAKFEAMQSTATQEISDE
jgi:hypothetical protein